MPRISPLSAALAVIFLCAGGAALAADSLSEPVSEPSAAPRKEAEKESAATENAEESGSLSGNFLSSRFARAQGDRQSAIHYLEESLAADPSNHKLAGQLLVLYLNSGDMAKALEKAHILQDDAKRELIVDLVLAMEDVHYGRMAGARTKLRHVFDGTGTAVWMPLFDAWISLGLREVKKPLTAAGALPKGEKAPAFLIYHLALINDLAGFKDAAEKQYEAALTDQSKAPFRAVEAAADFYRRNRMSEKLAQIKLDYINAHPSMSALVDSDTTTQMASLLAQDKAKPKGGRLIATPQEGISEVLFTMASVLYTLDSGQDTQLYLRMALYLQPDFPLAQLLLGNALEQEGKYAEAAEVYGGIDSGSPLSERALLRKAFMVERTGKIDEALAMLDTRAAESPEDYDAYVAKGDLLRTRSRFNDAAQAYSAALERIKREGPQQWGIYFARGACYERLGMWDKAEVDLRKALALNPDQPEVMNYLGYGIMIQGGDLPHARKLIEQAYALQPNSPQIVDSMGWMLFKTGDVQGAVQLLEQAIEMLPGDATVNDHLGDAYWQAGRKTEARYQWQRALTFSPEPVLEESLQRKLKEGLEPSAVVSAPDKEVHAATEQPATRTN